MKRNWNALKIPNLEVQVSFFCNMMSYFCKMMSFFCKMMSFSYRIMLCDLFLKRWFHATSNSMAKDWKNCDKRQILLQWMNQSFINEDGRKCCSKLCGYDENFMPMMKTSLSWWIFVVMMIMMKVTCVIKYCDNIAYIIVY